MNPERWQRVKEVLYATLEREPSARSRFLEETCAGDEPKVVPRIVSVFAARSTVAL